MGYRSSRRVAVIAVTVTGLLAFTQNFDQVPSEASSSNKVRTIACDEGTGKTIILKGRNKLAAGCDFYGSFLIQDSDTTLDCQGSTLWGLANRDRHYYESSKENFSAKIDDKKISVLSRAITIESDKHPIWNIEVKNCNIKAFQGAVIVKNSRSGSEWLWEMAAEDRVLSTPVAKYKSNPNDVNKTRLMNALRAYDWQSSTLPSQIRKVTPRKINFSNIYVNLTSKAGVYVDHHVTDVTFDRLVVRRASGPGMYLEFGSRANVIRNSEFSDNGREGIAIDSSARNLVEHSVFKNNNWGGVFLYRNCWEHFDQPGTIGGSDERGNYFPRTQGSDANRILRNTFYPNDSEDPGRNVGVWIASRQAVAARRPCGLYQMAPGPKGRFYHEDRARNTVVVGNRFAGVLQGVVVEDNGAKIFGNQFDSNVDVAVNVGTPIRPKVDGLTGVQKTRVAFNVIHQPAKRRTLEQVVPVDKASESDTGICSNFGASIVNPTCTPKFLQILKSKGLYDDFIKSAKDQIKSQSGQ